MNTKTNTQPMDTAAFKHQTTLDAIAGGSLVFCTVLALVAAEFGAPVLAGIGAAGAVGTGVVRLFHTPKKDRPK